MKIYDCFTFFNELDILEIRLNELYNSVDYFVLVESKLSFSNTPKSLFFEDNKHRFTQFLDKIIHIVIDKFEDNTDSPRLDGLHHNWTREEENRRMIFKGLAQANDEDIICVSDVDEIFNHRLIEQIRANGIENDTIIQVLLLMYKFKLNCLFQDYRNWQRPSEKHFKDLFKNIPEFAGAFPWQGPGICTFKTLKQYCNSDPHLLRAYAKPLKNIPPQGLKFTQTPNVLGGWHLCSMLDLIYKMRNFAHANEISKKTDAEILKFTSEELITKTKNISINNNIYYDAYPKFIIDNLQRFINLDWTLTNV